ncbi:glycoside hydrolase superfamily [Mycena belliarum]|uniref:Glycoside hydrolase superfamily n=1 Tax=Mycena belliarum TaxID=1033014 RepID=A0AAD6XLU3_9AGAR|nr:glycoside hydrolase superfamily [Mycena belliae]
MPAPLANAVCGPQVPGTVKAAPGTNLSTLNPCPLNACCDIWGQCGTTSDFCTPSGTGAPGTAAPGTNGCISNCGTDIVIGFPPAEFRRIAYFESFNLDRPCLNMDISEIDTSQHTHVHFAFLDLTSNFEVDITRYREQFDQLVQLKGIKRIVSWTMSTDPSTYAIFRNAVSAANRQTFASNLVAFVNQWNLDGVDIDWEYPGEQDVPGIPADSADDGQNLATFLVVLRSLLDFSKSISIATPASYWYLRDFPIGVMAQSLDYIVYMTYDLHGQWDYGNAFSSVGCPTGNCLRSHVNLTETLNALSMITKAGVNTSKLVVGITSYGRSFQMTTPGCRGPMCTYTGPLSGAAPGPCTETPGYIANAEISQIIAQNGNVQTFHDSGSDSDILVYDSVQWVAYMGNTTKATRTSLYKGMNMGGVSDWAVDLEMPPTPTSPSQPSAPAESGSFPDPIGANGYMNPYLRNCTPEQSKMLDEAWSEAATLAQGHYEWWPNGKWQDAMTLYMGVNSKNDQYVFITIE